MNVKKLEDLTASRLCARRNVLPAVFTCLLQKGQVIETAGHKFVRLVKSPVLQLTPVAALFSLQFSRDGEMIIPPFR
jgi:hypothetical protein